jgi:hypothetical protein
MAGGAFILTPKAKEGMRMKRHCIALAILASANLGAADSAATQTLVNPADAPEAHSAAAANTQASPTVVSTPDAWHPVAGSQSVDFTALNGTGIGLTTWHTDRYSEQDLLTAGISHFEANISSVQPWPPNDNASFQDYSTWNISVTSLQRWRLSRLGRHAHLNLLIGPYAAYTHIQSDSNVSYASNAASQSSYTYDTYTIGLKAGLDVELFIVEGWSLQLGYVASGAWFRSFEPENASGNTTYTYSFTNSEWTVSSGSAQAGLNYYFR